MIPEADTAGPAPAKALTPGPEMSAAAPPAAPPGWTFGGWLEQTKALTKKNFLVQRRSVLATAAQLGVGIVFLVLLTLLKWSVASLNEKDIIFTDSRSPPVVAIEPLPRCIVGSDSPLGLCYGFVYAPDTAETQAIVDHLLNTSDLPARSGAPNGTAFGARAFADGDAIDQFLVSNPNTTQVSIIFRKHTEWATTGRFAYDLQVNMTRNCNELGVLDCTEPDRDLLLPAQVMLDQAFLRTYGDDPTASIGVSFSNFPHPDLAIGFDVMESFGAAFLFISVMFNFVIQGVQIVQEKEGRLRMALRQIGMLDSAYWASWYISLISTNTVMCLLMIIVGHALGFDFFGDNAFGLYTLLFWLTTLSFSGLACLFSTLTSKTGTIRNIGILLFIVGYIAAPITNIFIFNDGKEKWDVHRTWMSLLTPFLFRNGDAFSICLLSVPLTRKVSLFQRRERRTSSRRPRARPPRG